MSGSSISGHGDNQRYAPNPGRLSQRRIAMPALLCLTRGIRESRRRHLRNLRASSPMLPPARPLTES